ncbi:toprim domain-containing protein [Candidatus Tisiphia endosymbiont of Micropterix aruncella]|uniref:toprim domain-containing protein n=1 Tax=Candidatus Tisiphia endosymbiont of Micropterix aruncella TaxID=3066271 RepID=UPI003AA7E917
MNDTNKQTNDSQEVISVGQQEGAKNTNPPTYNNSHSEREYQSNLNRPPEIIDLKQKFLLGAKSIATSLFGKPNEYLYNNHTLCQEKKGEISVNPSKDRAALDELYELDKFDKYTTEQRQKAKDAEMTRIKHVQTQYKNSNPVQYLTEDQVVREYLSKRCGIKTAAHQISPDIRGVMMMWDSSSKMYHSALLAFARDCKGTISGVQAIYFNKDNVLVNKHCLGKISGSFVEIQKGMSTDSQDNASATNITIIAGEVENALSLQEAVGFNNRILCSLGVINIENYQPQVNESILIAADNDGSDAVSLRTVTTAKAKLEQQGAIVSIVMPPKAGDFNDILKNQGKEAIKEILVPEIGKLAIYRHNNIKSMFQRQFGIRISKNALAITNTRFWICINCISVNSYINCSS